MKSVQFKYPFTLSVGLTLQQFLPRSDAITAHINRYAATYRTIAMGVHVHSDIWNSNIDFTAPTPWQ
jgi:hypothetical protein